MRVSVSAENVEHHQLDKRLGRLRRYPSDHARDFLIATVVLSATVAWRPVAGDERTSKLVRQQPLSEETDPQESGQEWAVN